MKFTKTPTTLTLKMSIPSSDAVTLSLFQQTARSVVFGSTYLIRYHMQINYANEAPSVSSEQLVLSDIAAELPSTK